jgi:hypothetical protein
MDISDFQTLFETAKITGEKNTFSLVMVRAGTGALIASQGRRGHCRYYWWDGNCYHHGRSGGWYRASQINNYR